MLTNPKKVKRNDGLIERRELSDIKKRIAELSDDMTEDELNRTMNDLLRKKAEKEKLLNE